MVNTDLFNTVINQFSTLLINRGKNIDDYLFENTESDYIDIFIKCKKIIPIHLCKFSERDITKNSLKWTRYKTYLLTYIEYICSDFIDGLVNHHDISSNNNIINTLKEIATNYNIDRSSLLKLEKEVRGFGVPHNFLFNRPVKCGVSTSNGSDHQRHDTCCSAGTLGFLVENSGTYYCVSNSHVFVNHEPTIVNDETSTRVDDLIVQPGALDSGCNPNVVDENSICTLTAWSPLNSTNQPPVDIAIAKVQTDKVDLTGSIEGVGFVKTTNFLNAIDPVINMSVQKSGRTTGVTQSTITLVDVSVNVNYSSCNSDTPFTIQYDNCFAIDSPNNSFGGAGDSGSLISDFRLDANVNNPVGVLFAGNSQFIIGLPIKPVLQYIDDLLTSSHGTTTIVGSDDNISGPCGLSGQVTEEMKGLHQIMKDNHDTIMGIEGLCACGIGLVNNIPNITMLVNSDLIIPSELKNYNINVIKVDEPFKAMV